MRANQAGKKEGEKNNYDPGNGEDEDGQVFRHSAKRPFQTAQKYYVTDFTILEVQESCFSCCVKLFFPFLTTQPVRVQPVPPDGSTRPCLHSLTVRLEIGSRSWQILRYVCSQLQDANTSTITYTTAIASTSTLTSLGSRPTCTAARAGGSASKYDAYTSFTEAKSSMSAK